MGLVWRQRRRLGRRSWLNLSTRGVSASARRGPVTVNTRGRWTVRLPFGFSWRGRV